MSADEKSSDLTGANDRRIGSEDRPLRVAVIGSGPSGFYAAEALLRNAKVSVEVHMFDRLPTPFGMVRGGVAPDHQSIKTVTRVYHRSATRAGFRFFGNVELGRDVKVAELRRFYHQIVYATGNEQPRTLGIPGEALAGCIPGAHFVGWYNGHPDYWDFQLDIPPHVRSVAVVGNGNVAVDVVRILARDPEDLVPTDMPSYALEALRRSQITDVYMLGRRGPIQAAFTPAEVKELGKLSGVAPVVRGDDLAFDDDVLQELERLGPRSVPAKNLGALQGFLDEARDGRRRIHFRFLVSPLRILGDEQGRVRAIELCHNELRPDDQGVLRPRPTEETELLEVQMVLPAIGYHMRRIPGVPYDERSRLIANRDGRVLDPQSREPFYDQYAVGWAQSGPRGLIGSHKAPAKAIVSQMLEDVDQGRLPRRDLLPEHELLGLLRDRDVRVVSFEDWQTLDDLERRRGVARGAAREKFTRISDMLDALAEESSRS